MLIRKKFSLLVLCLVALCTACNNKNTAPKAAQARQDSIRTRQDSLRQVPDSLRRIVYLTFDDGPSGNTPRILAILKQYGVKATFFVVGHREKYNHFIADEYRAGHVVAAHSFSHDYCIYRSQEAYFDDLEQIEQVIEQQTGHRTWLVRFPGGSSNHVNWDYNGDHDFMYRLSQEVLRRGYQYVDWNATDGDAETRHPLAADCIAKACRIKRTPACLLMHDTDDKDGTVEALPTIIQFYKDNGFEFRVITRDYVCHHPCCGHPKEDHSYKLTPNHVVPPRYPN